MHLMDFTSHDTSETIRPQAPLGHKVVQSWYARYVKRAIDLAAVLICLPIVVPVIAIGAVLAALGGPSAFYTQMRVGRDGRHFRLWKLRTMVPDAEAKLEAHLAQNQEACAEWAVTQKLKNDPRITPMGHFLRRTSLDELPQLWNVLKGDMSLVGPRPMLPEQQASYPGHAYYDLRPGITGNWQVSSRNNSAFVERAGFDDAYGREISLWTDLRLLARTCVIVLRATGL